MEKKMLSYKDLAKYFGTKLSGPGFKNFLSDAFDDLTDYNVSKSIYISSEKTKIELGFKNEDAVYDDDEQVVFEKGSPVFSLFNLFPESGKIVTALPYGVHFSDTRPVVLQKTGATAKTINMYDKIFKRTILADHYELEDLKIRFDYHAETAKINFIQIVAS